MSASDLRDDIRKESKTAGEWFLLFLSTPLIIYYTILSLWDVMTDLNRKYADKLFLKRIRMTEEEFEQFMKYKHHVMNAKLRPQPSYDDEDNDPEWEMSWDGENEPSDEELQELHTEVHDKD